MTNNQQLEEIEITLLLDGVYEVCGYDFRSYAPASLKRRIHKYLHDEQLETITDLQKKVLHNESAMKRFLNTLTISVTDMFRDPAFFLILRQQVVPWLKTYPFIRIWVAGCATGEEVYSLSIALQEEGIDKQVIIYATDMSEDALKTAKEGIYPIHLMKSYTANYQKAGGHHPFSEYYTAKYDSIIFNDSLKKHIVWAHHNLVTDASFNEFNLILCRNVMIYFNQELHNHVHKLLYDSLIHFGILCLGTKESIRFTPYEKCYEAIDEKMKIYRKER
ncbi:MAG: protein-glutamate O-methyltransferase CheR [Candidatus Desantisbacteria bacterium]